MLLLIPALCFMVLDAAVRTARTCVVVAMWWTGPGSGAPQRRGVAAVRVWGCEEAAGPVTQFHDLVVGQLENFHRVVRSVGCGAITDVAGPLLRVG